MGSISSLSVHCRIPVIIIKHYVVSSCQSDSQPTYIIKNLPALVDKRKTKTLEFSLWNSFTISLRSERLQAPSSLKNEYFLKFIKSSRISNILVIWQKMRTLSPPFFFFSFKIISSWANFEESAIRLPKSTNYIFVRDYPLGIIPSNLTSWSFSIKLPHFFLNFPSIMNFWNLLFAMISWSFWKESEFILGIIVGAIAFGMKIAWSSFTASNFFSNENLLSWNYSLLAKLM